MLRGGGGRFSSDMLVRIARGVEAVATTGARGERAVVTGGPRATTAPARAETQGRGVSIERSAPATQPTVEQALVSPSTAPTTSATAGVDLASITRTAMRSAGLGAPARPLVSPVSQAIATRAHLSKEDEAPESADVAPATPAEAPGAPAGKPIDLDALAAELAGKISARMQRDVERRGRW